MPDVTDRQVLEALRGVADSTLGGDVVALGLVKDLTAAGGVVKFRLLVPSPDYPGRDRLRAAAEAAVRALPGVRRVTVDLGVREHPATAPSPQALAGVKHIVAVASGKGGVGKSTVSANLAVALTRAGASVGIMDVDVYGPTIPGLLGIPRMPDGAYDVRVGPDQKIIPPDRHGVRVISIGFFTREDDPVIVRGPILNQAVRQFLQDVTWGELDYLICDLPPGTGDVPLSLAQLVPLTGVIIVATPQDVALRIAAKSLRMFEKLRVDVLGIVENMSYFICPHCSGRTEIFAHGGVRSACERYGVPFLGEIPLDVAVRASGDAGRPIVLDGVASGPGRAFDAVARAVVEQVARADRRHAAESPLAPVTFADTKPMEV
jgi:ATP-binding protein involved in chromosome partitioning